MRKSQVTLEYDDNNKPVRIDAIVVSHSTTILIAEAKMLAKINDDVIRHTYPRVKVKV